MELSDLARATDEQRSLILTQAQLRLEHQNNYANAADQRAATITGAAVALSAAAVGVAADAASDGKLTALAVAAGVAALAFSRASWFAMRALAPDHFDPPGYRPVDFLSDVRTGKTSSEIELAMIENAQSMLSENGARLDKRADHAKAAMAWMVRAPLVAFGAGLVWLLASWLLRVS